MGVFSGRFRRAGDYLVWANTKRPERSERAVACRGRGVFMGGSKTSRTFRTSDQNFLKKMRFTY